MDPERLLELLAAGDPVSLAEWHGEPLSRGHAESWLEAVRARRHPAALRPSAQFGFRLADMIARYWAGQDAAMCYENLLATIKNPAERARLELCYGQLLLARRLEPAWRHLDAGFGAAANLFEAHDYFVVMKRHSLLRQLALSPVAAEPAGLEELLREARVISRLRGGSSPSPTPPRVPHQDTVD